jgi:hypothetical protein
MSQIRSFIIAVVLAVAPHFAAVAYEDIDGFVGRSAQGEYFFIASNFIKFYPLKSANAEVDSQLKRLGHMDAIHGTGSYTSKNADGSGGEVVLETIDFVGLNRLLGAWTSETYLFNFKNFAEVSLYPAVGRLRPVGAGNMKYAIAPGDGTAWRIFFSNANQVVLASLNLMAQKQQAILTFYDVNTGAEKSSILLTKVRN